MKRRISLMLASFVIIVLGGALMAQTAQAAGYYWRWTTPLPTVLCDSGGGNVYFYASAQYIEYNLPAGASVHKYTILNGVTINDLIDSLSGSGTAVNPAFSDSLAASSYTIQLQDDTIINGAVVYRSTLTMSCPDGTASISNEDFSSGYCPPIPDGSVVGALPNEQIAFYEPGKITVPNVVINPGTYWVIGEDDSGQYYEIMLACQFLWVPIDTMQPSYQAPWTGQPLPTRVVS